MNLELPGLVDLQVNGAAGPDLTSAPGALEVVAELVERGVVVSLGSDVLLAGLIVDGHHLDPWFVRTAWRAPGPSRFLSVSVRLLDGTLAAASLLGCLRVLVAQTGCTVAEAVAAAIETPLRLLGLGPRPETITVTPGLGLVP